MPDVRVGDVIHRHASPENTYTVSAIGDIAIHAVSDRTNSVLQIIHPDYNTAWVNKRIENTKQIGGTHYSSMSIDPWTIIDANGLDFYEGNALKYLLRYKSKNGKQDLEKAIHYIEKIMEGLSDVPEAF